MGTRVLDHFRDLRLMARKRRHKNPHASIRSKDRSSPFNLRVIQTQAGVFWDVVDTELDHRRFIISTTPHSTRLLAQWILDNVQE